MTLIHANFLLVKMFLTFCVCMCWQASMKIALHMYIIKLQKTIMPFIQVIVTSKEVCLSTGVVVYFQQNNTEGKQNTRQAKIVKIWL